MSLQAILLPLFVQIGLTYFLGFWLGRLRRGLVLSRQVRWQDIALRQRPWPGRAEQVSHSFQNQFEIPVLFYVLVVLAVITKKADLAFVIMEWAFAVSRIAHAFVHTTTNHVPTRFRIFAFGFVALFLMWSIFVVRILFTPPSGIP